MQSQLHGVTFQGKCNYEKHNVATSHSHLPTFSVKITHQSKSDQGTSLSQRPRNHEAGPGDKKIMTPCHHIIPQNTFSTKITYLSKLN